MNTAMAQESNLAAAVDAPVTSLSVILALWRLRDGRKGRFFAPIILGLVGLLPAAFLYLVMWAFFHYGPG